MKLAFDDIKKYYKQGFWDDAKIANAVEKDCITNEQFEEITGHSIYEIGDFSSAQERKQNENKKAGRISTEQSYYMDRWLCVWCYRGRPERTCAEFEPVSATGCSRSAQCET